MEQKKITQGDLVSMFLRSNLQQASFQLQTYSWHLVL